MKGADTRSGFTILEVILFLAISGLMFTGIIAGFGGIINNQRYDDSVSSLQDFIQNQFSIASNVRNSRPTDQVCTATGISGGTTMPRGTSNCIVVGRIINAEPSDNGRRLIANTVYATADTYNDSSTEEVLLSSLGLIPSPNTDSLEQYDTRWQTELQVSGVPAQFSILILRLPTTGIIRTYILNTNPTVSSWSNYWTSSEDNVEICVNSNGLTAIPTQGVRVLSGATGSSGVQRIAVSDGVC